MVLNYNLQNEDASDPAQIILLTLAIFYVEEVEQVFRDFANKNKPNPNAMKEYSAKQGRYT